MVGATRMPTYVHTHTGSLLGALKISYVSRQAVLDGLRLRADAAAEGLASEVRLREELWWLSQGYLWIPGNLDLDFPPS